MEESTTILNACTKKVWKLIEGTTYVYVPFLFSHINDFIYELIADYDLHLKKPVSSRYGNGLFPQIFRSDGHTFNVSSLQPFFFYFEIHHRKLSSIKKYLDLIFEKYSLI